MSLDVNEENFKAISFYRGLGLSEVGTYKVMDKQGFITFQTPFPGFTIAFKSVVDVPSVKEEKQEECSSLI